MARGLVERLESGLYQLSVSGLVALEEGAFLKSGYCRKVGERKTPVFAEGFQQRAWKAMRLQGRFTIGDIVQLAAREETLKPEVSLQKLFVRLSKAGYVVELPVRIKGFKQWRLVRDTGAKAPCYVLNTKSFKDRNTLEVFPCL